MSGVLRMPRPLAVMAYSGPRNRILGEYQRIQQERQLGNLTNQEFRYIVGKLNKQQVKYNRSIAKRAEKREEKRIAQEVIEQEYAKTIERQRKAEANRLAEERARRMVEAVRQEREKKEQAKVARRAERSRASKAEIKKFQDTVVYDETLTAKTFWGNEDNIYNACKKLEGRDSMYLQITRNGEVIVSKMLDIGEMKRYNIYYMKVRPELFYGGSDGDSIFTDGATVRIVLSRAQDIPSKRITQAFREGEKHCVLEPLLQLFLSYVANSESASSKKRYTTIVNRIRHMMVEYEDGVPEDKMEEVAKNVYRCIVIYDVLGNETMRYNKLSPKMFHFTNTRENHVEAGHITMDKQYSQVTQEELNTILHEHDASQEFYLFRGDHKKGIPQSLRSSRGAWAVFNADYEAFQEFNKKVGVRNYRINAVKYPVVNSFIKDGTIVHAGAVALCKSPNRIDNVSHYDMKKAYTQHDVAPYFNGFLGHVQQWAMLSGKGLDFVREHLGMFRFRVVNDVVLLRKLGMRCGMEYTLPGPELLYMCDVLGLEVEMVAGLWGSRAEIHYTPEMLEKRRYCTWAGKLDMESSHDVYMFKGSYDWACHLKAEIGEDRVSFWGDFICVKNPKGAVWTTHHLFAFITSYSRINMLEMMRRVDGELVKVVLDGLYFRGTMDTEGLAVTFSENKKLVTHPGFTTWYHTASVVLDWVEYSPMLDGDCVLAGAGGTGKSYRVFTDKSIYQPLYVVPSHMLGRKFRNEYGVQYTTIHKLIGMDCRPYGEENGDPHNIFIDELTMIECEWMEKAIAMYPSSRFYIAGDIDGERWYQCRNGGAGNYSEIWIPSREEWRYVDFTVDMRSKDEELRVFKNQLRDVMRGVFTDGGMEDAKRINEIVGASVTVESFNKAVGMFKKGDVWIAGTHKTNRRLIEAGVVSGYVNARKEISDVEEGEMRGAFTVHSFQGLTISDKKVFVSLDMFEYAMLYTAVSRVCHFNQLVFVS